MQVNFIQHPDQAAGQSMEARVDAAYMAIADSIYGRPAEADAGADEPGEGH